MKSGEYGVVAIPAPQGGQQVASFMAGINLSIFKNTKNTDGALKFVKFMTSKEQQKTLDKPFTALPVVKGGTVEFTDSKQEAKTFRTSWRPGPSRCRWCRPRRRSRRTSATP